MKSTIGRLALLTLIVSASLRAQIPDSLLSYYPMHSGDVWQYQITTASGPAGTSTSSIAGDTVMLSGHRYWAYSSSGPWVRIDSSTGSVYKLSAGEESQFDSLLTPNGNYFLYNLSGANSHLGATVWFTVSDTILGVPTSVRLLSGPVQSTDYTIARGFGIVKMSTSYDLPPFQQTSKLIYAKINGVEYGTAVSVHSPDLSEMSFQLRQNYPNPFNPSTTIEYSLATSSSVRLTISNVLGQVVAEWNVPRQGPGVHAVTWTPRLSSGAYLYRLEALDLQRGGEPLVQCRRMLLLK